MNQPQHNLLLSRKFLILIVFVLGFCAYSFNLTGKFKLVDDQVSIVKNETVKNLTAANVNQIFHSSFFGDKEKAYYRPLVLLSFALEYRFFGPDPFYFYLTNILLHVFNALLLFFAVEALTKRTLPAFWVALLFVIHPVHWEAVANIAGRSILLCAFGYFAAFLFFVKFDQEPEKKKYLLLSLLGFAWALLSKESGVTFLLILLSYVLFFESSSGIKGIFSKALNRLWPYLIIFLGYMATRRSLGIVKIYYWENYWQMFLGVATFLRGVLTYLRLIVLPYDLHFERSIAYFFRPNDPELIWTFIFYGLLLALLVRRRKSFSPVQKFFLAWFCLDLILVAQVIPVKFQQFYAALFEHFLYIPLAGILAFAVFTVEKLWASPKRRGLFSRQSLAVLVAGFCSFLFVTSITQSIYAANEVAMLKRTLDFAPYSLRVRRSYAFTFVKDGNYKEAERQYRLALDAEPWDAAARIGLGKTLCDQDRYWEGIAEYDKVHDAGDLTEMLKKNKRLAYGILIDKYKNKINQEPQNAALYYSLGVMYSKTDKMMDALANYKIAVDLDPTHTDALFNLASSYEALGRLPEAAGYYEQMLAVKKSRDYLDYHAYQHLGKIYQILGDEERAKDYSKKAKELEGVVLPKTKQ